MQIIAILIGSMIEKWWMDKKGEGKGSTFWGNFPLSQAVNVTGENCNFHVEQKTMNINTP